MKMFKKRNISTLFFSIIIFHLFIIAPFSSEAQENPLDKTNGPYATIHLNGNYLNISDINGLFGGGLGGRLGLSFKQFSIYTGLTLSGFNGQRLSSNFEQRGVPYLKYDIVGTQIHFRSTDAKFIPFVEAAFNIFAITPPKRKNDPPTTATVFGGAGIGATAGGGVKYFLTNSLAFEGALSFSYGSYSKKFKSYEAQLNVGFSLYPF